MNVAETTHVLNGAIDENSPNGHVALNNEGRSLQRTRSASSSSLTSAGSTPSRGMTPPTCHRALYDDFIPNNPFWVEINPKPGFNRDDYEIDEQEFHIVGIFGEIG